MNKSHNPFVGGKPFGTGETFERRFRGRETDIERFLNSFLPRRFALLHSETGLGKTSFIRAGIAPRMQKRGFQVVPDVSAYDIIAESQEGKVSLETAFCRVLNNKLSDGDRRRSIATDAKLNEYFRYSEYIDTNKAVFLVLDQVEAFMQLEASPQGVGQLETFCAALSSVVSRKGFWFVAVIRENAVGMLDTYSHVLNIGMIGRFRLPALTREGAHDAIEVALECQHGAQSVAPVSFQPGLIEKIIADSESAGGKVDPFQLQIACHGLFEAAVSSRLATTITYSKLGGMSKLLAKYCRKEIRRAALIGKNPGVEDDIRAWLTSSLLSGGNRRQALAPMNISEKCLSSLSSSYLLTRQIRGGIRWYELSHDRLAVALLEDCQDRLNELSGWKAKFAGWAHADQSEKSSFLLSTDDEIELAESEKGRGAKENSHFTRFIDESKDAVKRVEQINEFESIIVAHKSRIKWLVSAFGLLAVAGLVVPYSLTSREIEHNAHEMSRQRHEIGIKEGRLKVLTQQIAEVQREAKSLTFDKELEEKKNQSLIVSSISRRQYRINGNTDLALKLAVASYEAVSGYLGGENRRKIATVIAPLDAALRRALDTNPSTIRRAIPFDLSAGMDEGERAGLRQAVVVSPINRNWLVLDYPQRLAVVDPYYPRKPVDFVDVGEHVPSLRGSSDRSGFSYVLNGSRVGIGRLKRNGSISSQFLDLPEPMGRCRTQRCLAVTFLEDGRVLVVYVAESGGFGVYDGARWRISPSDWLRADGRMSAEASVFISPDGSRFVATSGNRYISVAVRGLAAYTATAFARINGVAFVGQDLLIAHEKRGFSEHSMISLVPGSPLNCDYFSQVFFRPSSRSRNSEALLHIPSHKPTFISVDDDLALLGTDTGVLQAWNIEPLRKRLADREYSLCGGIDKIEDGDAPDFASFTELELELIPISSHVDSAQYRDGVLVAVDNSVPDVLIRRENASPADRSQFDASCYRDGTVRSMVSLNGLTVMGTSSGLLRLFERDQYDKVTCTRIASGLGMIRSLVDIDDNIFVGSIDAPISVYRKHVDGQTLVAFDELSSDHIGVYAMVNAGGSLIAGHRNPCRNSDCGQGHYLMAWSPDLLKQAGKPIFLEKDIDGWVRSLAWDGKRKLLYAGLENGRIAVIQFDPQTKKFRQLQSFDAHNRSVHDLSVREDGVLASAGYDRLLRVWKFENESEATIQSSISDAEIGGVNVVSWRTIGNGEYELLAAGYDTVVRSYRFFDGHPTPVGDPREFRGHQYQVTSMLVGDGRIVTGDSGGNLVVWKDSLKELASTACRRLGESRAFDDEDKRRLPQLEGLKLPNPCADRTENAYSLH